MHMIGISGRCASGARAPPATSTPSPSTPAHVEGARLAFKRKTGCYVVAEPRALGGPFHYATGVFNPCLVTDGTEGGVFDSSRHRRDEPLFLIAPLRSRERSPKTRGRPKSRPPRP